MEAEVSAACEALRSTDWTERVRGLQLVATLAASFTAAPADARRGVFVALRGEAVDLANAQRPMTGTFLSLFHLCKEFHREVKRFARVRGFPEHVSIVPKSETAETRPDTSFRYRNAGENAAQGLAVQRRLRGCALRRPTSNDRPRFRIPLVFEIG